MLVSILINNYNYGRFVSAAIDSALNQPGVATEVIVVDDGSTEDSPQIIRRYEDRADVVLKQNGGQASAVNEAFARARGDAIILLDADDVLLPHAAATAAEALAAGGISRVTWQMQVIDATGDRRPLYEPAEPPAAGDLLPQLVSRGPMSYLIAPTSGNAWSRAFLEAVMPIPEALFRRGADGYLLLLAPLHGQTALIDEPLSCYRRHENNFLASRSEFAKMDLLIRRHRVKSKLLAEALTARGIDFDQAGWAHAHWDELSAFRAAVGTHVPLGQTMVLVDQDQLNVGSELDGRPRRHLMERDGVYWGAPADGEAAVDQLRKMHRQGARYVVITSAARWWLDHYRPLRLFLEEHADRLISEPAAVIDRLRD